MYWQLLPDHKTQNNVHAEQDLKLWSNVFEELRFVVKAKLL